jgi:hypothetical protein
MNEELVELVVQLYEKNWGVKDYGLARAVVALATRSVTTHRAQVMVRTIAPPPSAR